MKLPWQYSYIDKLVKKEVLDELLNFRMSKSVTPHSLLKFYAPEEYNFLDLENKKLWLSDPLTFNDPFDCKMAYNEDDYIKHIIVKYILDNLKYITTDSKSYFTKADLNRIYNTRDTLGINHRGYSKHIYSFQTVLSEILGEKNEMFRNEINNYINDNNNKINRFLSKNKYSDTRIACFSSGDYDSSYTQTLMWSHYARNHEGFCVEYDLDLIKESIDHSKEKVSPIILNLFQVYYTAYRINLPKTILYRIVKDEVTAKDYDVIAQRWLRAYMTKSIIWRYEKEWRLILDRENYNSDFKIDFPFAVSIRIGCNASRKTKERLIQIGEKLNIKTFMTYVDKNTYEINGFYSMCSYYNDFIFE